MLESWRTKLRQADDARRQNRLDEAARLIRTDNLVEYAPGKKLASEVSFQLSQRSVGKMQEGDTLGAWSDYDLAVSVDGMTQSLGEVGSYLEQMGLSEVERLLGSDDIPAALRHLDALEGHSRTPRTTALRDVARFLQTADQLTQRGRYSDAVTQLENAKRILPELPAIAARQNRYQDQQQRIRSLEDLLFRNVSGEEWSQALVTADQILEFSPEHQMAIDARRRAWSFVGNGPEPTTEAWTPPSQPVTNASNGATVLDPVSNPSHETDASFPRVILWVDGVGGFLVCQQQEVTLGQAVPDNDVSIAIQADLSRTHATFRRDGESYILTPQGRVSVNGQVIQERALLKDGDELTFGDVVKLRFNKPHALSATARLDFISRHRTFPTADSILLMAESCVLGPRVQNHIVCRDWSGDVVLFKQDDNLFCRSLESIQVDGESCDGRGQLSPSSRVVGEDFSMTLERID